MIFYFKKSSIFVCAFHRISIHLQFLSKNKKTNILRDKITEKNNKTEK